MQLLLVSWRLSTLSAERWLPPRGPGEHDDGCEINKSIAKGGAPVLDTMQRGAVGHHYRILPFISEVAERLWGCEVKESVKREELQSVMWTFFRSLSL
jgi:hypothetical protein